MQNLKHTANGGIYLEYEHPGYGLIPTCAHPNDPATASLYAAALAQGNIAPRDLIPNPQIAEIKTRLVQIDVNSIRAIRSADTVRMTEYEAQAQALRDEMAALPALV